MIFNQKLLGKERNQNKNAQHWNFNEQQKLQKILTEIRKENLRKSHFCIGFILRIIYFYENLQYFRK